VGQFAGGGQGGQKCEEAKAKLTAVCKLGLGTEQGEGTGVVIITQLVMRIGMKIFAWWVFWDRLDREKILRAEKVGKGEIVMFLDLKEDSTSIAEQVDQQKILLVFKSAGRGGDFWGPWPECRRRAGS